MTMRYRRGACASGLALVCAVSMSGAGSAAAQEDERIPTVPAGTPAVLFPVQAARPTAGGAWPAGAAGDREVIEMLNAELAFAFGEEEGAENWALPSEVEARLARNPMIKVSPGRLAYHGLLREPERHEQIYEPLHTQLRQVAALFNARIVVLPLMVWYRPPTEDERDAAAASGEQEPAEGRAVLLAAVIDTRRSAVLWHGRIEGGAAAADSHAALATLAFEVARHLAPS